MSLPFSFSTVAHLSDALLIRDVDGHYRVASADKVLEQGHQHKRTVQPPQQPHHRSAVPRPRGWPTGRKEGRAKAREVQAHELGDMRTILHVALTQPGVMNKAYDHAYRLLLMKRTLARSDAELFGHRPRCLEVAKRLAALLLSTKLP